MNMLSELLEILVFLFLNFTDSAEEFEDRIMQKKMKIPKMSIKNSGNSIENFFGDERMPLRHKKVGYVMYTVVSLLTFFYYLNWHH